MEPNIFQCCAATSSNIWAHLLRLRPLYPFHLCINLLTIILHHMICSHHMINAYSLSYVKASFVNFIEQNLLIESLAISCTLLVVELLWSPYSIWEETSRNVYCCYWLYLSHHGRQISSKVLSTDWITITEHVLDHLYVVGVVNMMSVIVSTWYALSRASLSVSCPHLAFLQTLLR